MALDGLTPAVVFPLFNFLLRIVQTAYEVAAVPAETSDYLKTISQVLADIKIAKELRKECLPNLSSNSLTVVENVIRNTENAMAGVEAQRVDYRAMIEPMIDMAHLLNTS